MKIALRLLSLVLVLASIAYLVHFARKNAAALPPFDPTLGAIGTFTLAVLFYQVTLLSSATAWHLLLRGLGERPAPRRSLAIFLVSQIGKYLPGNVGQYAGRWALAARSGVATGTVVASLVLETAGAVVVAAGAAGLGLVAGHSAGLLPPLPWGRIALVTAGLAVVASIALAVSPALRARFAGRWPAERPGPSVLAACLGLYALNLAIFAGIVLALGSRFFGAPPAPFLPVAGVFAAAWVAGFVTPGAPAGLGVREVILTAGLTPLWGPGVAVAVPVLFRLVTVAGDPLALGVGFLIDPGLARAAPESR